MSDFIVLIHSNSNGDPVKTGEDGHWVVVTDDQNPVPVNQLAAGGKYPHADCGEASVKSILASRGVVEPIVTIEHDADAASYGTTAAQLQKALLDFGIKSTVSKSYPAKNTPPFRVIMNPLGGRVERGEQAAYEAAYYGTTIDLADAPKPAPAPAPKPAAPVSDNTVRVVPRFDVVPRHPGGPLPIHVGPGSAERIKGSEPNGVRTVCDAWTYANAQFDPVAEKDDARWYRIYNNGGWIASAFVNGDAPDSTPLPPVKPEAAKPAPAKPAPKPAVKPVATPAAKPVPTVTAPVKVVAPEPAAPVEPAPEPAQDEQLTGVLPKPDIPANA